MLFEFENISVDIDVEETRDYYIKNDAINDCSCSGCRNYRQYIKDCNKQIEKFFISLGIDDLNCITRIIPFDVSRHAYEKDRCIYYMGFYHVKGQIIKKKKVKSHQEWIEIAKDFKIRITDEIDLLPDSFPKPYLQVEISAYIPWALDEENEYIV